MSEQKDDQAVEDTLQYEVMPGADRPEDESPQLDLSFAEVEEAIKADDDEDEETVAEGTEEEAVTEESEEAVADDEGEVEPDEGEPEAELEEEPVVEKPTKKPMVP